MKKSRDDLNDDENKEASGTLRRQIRSGCGHAYGSRPEFASDGVIYEPSVAGALRVRHKKRI